MINITEQVLLIEPKLYQYLKTYIRTCHEMFVKTQNMMKCRANTHNHMHNLWCIIPQMWTPAIPAQE